MEPRRRACTRTGMQQCSSTGRRGCAASMPRDVAGWRSRRGKRRTVCHRVRAWARAGARACARRREMHMPHARARARYTGISPDQRPALPPGRVTVTATVPVAKPPSLSCNPICVVGAGAPAGTAGCRQLQVFYMTRQSQSIFGMPWSRDRPWPGAEHDRHRHGPRGTKKQGRDSDKVASRCDDFNL